MLELEGEEGEGSRRKGTEWGCCCWGLHVDGEGRREVQKTELGEQQLCCGHSDSNSRVCVCVCVCLDFGEGFRV